MPFLFSASWLSTVVGLNVPATVAVLPPAFLKPLLYSVASENSRWTLDSTVTSLQTTSFGYWIWGRQHFHHRASFTVMGEAIYRWNRIGFLLSVFELVFFFFFKQKADNTVALSELGFIKIYDMKVMSCKQKQKQNKTLRLGPLYLLIWSLVHYHHLEHGICITGIVCGETSYFSGREDRLQKQSQLATCGFLRSHHWPVPS